MTQALFIAETDAEGRVIGLWQAGPELRIPRPISDAAEALDRLDEGNVSGAERAAVRAFLLTQITE